MTEIDTLNKRPYRTRPGDLEIRLLKDGRIVLIVPDPEILEMAKQIASGSEAYWQKGMCNDLGSESGM